MAAAEKVREMPAAGKPAKPFYFPTAEHLPRIARQKANNLDELLTALATVPHDFIFQHTFRTLQEHRFIRQGFSNDFARWLLLLLRMVEQTKARHARAR